MVPAAARGAAGATVVPTAAPSVEERLAQLQGLKAKGLVTEEEFAAKRAEILVNL